MRPIYLLDDSLSVEIAYCAEDADLEDNICFKVTESCPEEEKLFKHDESHLYLTRQQALALANALLSAVHQSEKE
jgi:hypothetical protein